jgi:hypothetical protein
VAVQVEKELPVVLDGLLQLFNGHRYALDTGIIILNLIVIESETVGYFSPNKYISSNIPFFAFLTSPASSIQDTLQ